MEKIFNLTSTFKSHTDEDGSVKIRGMASTSEFDRAGDSISSDAWTKGGLKNFEKNCITYFIGFSSFFQTLTIYYFYF